MAAFVQPFATFGRPDAARAKAGKAGAGAAQVATEMATGVRRTLGWHDTATGADVAADSLQNGTGGPAGSGRAGDAGLRARPDAGMTFERTPEDASSEADAAGTALADGAAADPDIALIRAVATGDEQALTALLRRHGARIRALAAGYSAAAGSADDVVQDTFWTIWRTASRFEDRGVKVASWITRIAVNRCIDLERRRKLRRFVGLEDAAEAADPDVGAERQLADRSRLAAVMNDIRALPARQRAAILIAAGGEHSTADIAESLGVTVGAAEQLLVRARRTLRMNLARREGEVR